MIHTVKTIVGKSGLVFLASMTIATSALAGYKITQTQRSKLAVESTTNKIPEKNYSPTTGSNNNGSVTPDNSTVLKTGESGKSQAAGTFPAPSKYEMAPVKTDTQSSAQGLINDQVNVVEFARASNAPLPDQNICLVTISGIVYNVQPLRSPHPGGDIFVCDTDMTAVYQGQHGANISQLAPYIYSESKTVTPSIATTAIVSDDEDSYEYDHENEDEPDDRYEEEYDD